MFLRKLAIVVFAVVFTTASVSHAVQYSFLPVNATGTYTSQFTSSYGNGVINVTDAFPNGGAGMDENNNPAIYPNNFTNLFPGTGLVQGHLAQTIYNYSSSVTFNMSTYNLSQSTVFGIWNITDEVSPGPGGQPVYQLAMLDSNMNPLPLTSLNYLGNTDNLTQVAGKHQLDINYSTGELFPGAVINGGNGIHTDAIFWNNIPQGTKQIVVYANLPPLNTIGDGVGYYFAEVVPEPASISLLAAGGAGLLLLWRRSRQ